MDICPFLSAGEYTGSAPSGAILNPAAGAAAARVGVGAAAAPAAQQVAQGDGGELYTHMLLEAGMEQDAGTAAAAALDGNDWRKLWAEGSDHELEGPGDPLMHTAGSASPMRSDGVVQQHQHKEQQQLLLAQMQQQQQQQQQLAASPRLLQVAGVNSTAATAAAVAAPAALGSSRFGELGLSSGLQQGADTMHLGGAGAGRREQVDDMLQAARNVVDLRAACTDAMGTLNKSLNVAKAAQGKVLAAELQLVLQLQKRREQQQQRGEQQKDFAALSAAASMGSLSKKILGPMQQELQEQLNMMSISDATTTASVQAAAAFGLGDQPAADTGAGANAALAAEGLLSPHRPAGDGLWGDLPLLQAQQQQQQVQVQNPQSQQWLQQQEFHIEQQLQAQQQQQHSGIGIPPRSLPRAYQQPYQQPQLDVRSHLLVAAMPTTTTLSPAAPHATPEIITWVA